MKLSWHWAFTQVSVLWTESGLCRARRVEKEGRRSGKCMILCTETIFRCCIFRLWTWASLNFGELNLHLPPQLKIWERERECGLSRLKEILFWRCYFTLWFLSCFCISGLCIFSPVFVQRRVTSLLSVLKIFVFCECTILVMNYFTELFHVGKCPLRCVAKWKCMIMLHSSGHIGKKYILPKSY